MGFIETLQTKKGKIFMGYLYGWGASIVIVGAMFKIQHWPGAGPMLVCGLSIEAVIFFFSAFEPIHDHDDWSLVYPELRGAHGHGAEVKAKKDPIAQELDRLLQDAKIGPELIESLGAGMKSLGDQAGKLSDITDATVAAVVGLVNVEKLKSSEQQTIRETFNFEYYNTINYKNLCYNNFIPWKQYQTISEETNGIVDDLHYSEKGHMDLANDLLVEINKSLKFPPKKPNSFIK